MPREMTTPARSFDAARRAVFSKFQDPHFSLYSLRDQTLR